jgi:maleylacetate reductase
LLTSGLPRVKADPTDLQARLDCQMGSWLSMGHLAAGVPMGASHGIGYVLGAVFDVPHRHTSCILLPSVMRWNKPVNAARQALAAAAMGRPDADAADLLDLFISGQGMPRSLGAVQIGPNPSASLNLLDRPLTRPSAAWASRQDLNKGACEANT